MAKAAKPAVETRNIATTNNGTSTLTPWSGAIPLLSQFTQGAQSAYDATSRTGYGGQLYAGLNPTQTGANAQMLALAPSLGQGAPDLNRLGHDTASGMYLDPSTNPWLARTGDVIARTATDNLTRSILPALADRAILGGAYGGAGYGVGQGIAAGDTSRSIADALTQMYGQNYSQERDRQMNAGGLFTQANNLAMQPSTVQAAVGGQQQQDTQAMLNAAFQQYQLQQQAPWNGMQQLASALGVVGPYGTTTTTGSGTTNGTSTMTPATASGGANFLQGAIGGASAGGVFGPWGAGIGGILGGLGGLFG